MNSVKKSAVISGVVFLLSGGLQLSMAHAAELRCRAENRNNARSRVSVDVKNLASGQYSATVTSGGGSASSLPKATVGDEVQVDFDSNAKDIAAGATAIAASFISGATTAEVRNTAGALIISGACEVK